MSEALKLTGQQRRILREGIVGAYPNPDDLWIFLAEQMDVQVGAIARGDTYKDKVFALIQDFEAEGRIEQFIILIVKGKKNSPYLTEVKNEFKSILKNKVPEKTIIYEDGGKNKRLILSKIIGATISVIVCFATISAVVLRPKEVRSCIILDARGCWFLRSFTSGESEVGANYGKLRGLLQKKDYQGANQETGRLLLWLTGREKEGYIDLRNMKRFPCRDIQTINQLWTENSNGRFGFKAQMDIWQSLKIYKFNEKSTAFGDEVGWRKDNRWLISPNELSFELRAPKGHLPARYGEGNMSGGWLVYPILFRLSDCDLE